MTIEEFEKNVEQCKCCSPVRNFHDSARSIHGIDLLGRVYFWKHFYNKRFLAGGRIDEDKDYVCTCCNHLLSVSIKGSALACCPDSNYVHARENGHWFLQCSPLSYSDGEWRDNESARIENAIPNPARLISGYKQGELDLKGGNNE